MDVEPSLPSLDQIQTLDRVRDAGKYFTPQNAIRWQVRDRFHPTKFLQQEFMDIATGQMVWRDVYTVDEDGNLIPTDENGKSFV